MASLVRGARPLTRQFLSQTWTPAAAASCARSLHPSSPRWSSDSATSSPAQLSPATAATPGETFASLLRNCKFTQLGDPVGKVLSGRIYHVVNDDVYIDFGHKFPCVCKRPRRLRNRYVRGAEVRVLVKSLELSDKFLGFEKEMTLLEADCVLLGLAEDGGGGRGRQGRVEVRPGGRFAQQRQEQSESQE